MGIIESAAERIAPFWISLPLKAFGGMKTGIAWLIGTPIRALTAALIVVSLLAWHFQNRAMVHANAARDQAAQFKTAQDAATQLAQDALHHQEAISQAKAMEANNAYQIQLADARSAADAYIGSHRMQQAAAAEGNASTTPATGKDRAADVPAILPADAIVVSADDVHKCTDATSYALKAHDWAISITAAPIVTETDNGDH